ncbi:MAG: hypothetical protein KatS3mg030_084 [Saprospiraceae bacterium]|nr:MAG: hypothetical protein KatS3mg030_084 [Saprospiraceae bacterium]
MQTFRAAPRGRPAPQESFLDMFMGLLEIAPAGCDFFLSTLAERFKIAPTQSALPARHFSNEIHVHVIRIAHQVIDGIPNVVTLVNGPV